MQTLVLGTPAANEPLESFFQRLGDEAVDVIGPDGTVRARVIPKGGEDSDERDSIANWVDPRIMAAINDDIDELDRLAHLPRSTTTTKELLSYLNSLPLPE